MEDRAIVIRPNGRLANRMFQYMLATEIGRRVGDAIPVCGLALPEWNIALPAPGSHANPTVVLERHVFNLDRTAYLLRTRALRTVVINGWGMRLEYYRGPEAYRPSFPRDAGSAFAARDDQLLINIRGEDILSGWHPRYFPLPFSFYEHVIERTGLSPVFMGQLDNGHHTKLNLAADAADAQEAVAVVLGDVDASALDRPGVVHARLTSVREKALVWPSGITPEQKAAALRQLAARNIIARY